MCSKCLTPGWLLPGAGQVQQSESLLSQLLALSGKLMLMSYEIQVGACKYSLLAASVVWCPRHSWSQPPCFSSRILLSEPPTPTAAIHPTLWSQWIFTHIQACHSLCCAPDGNGLHPSERLHLSRHSSKASCSKVPSLTSPP